MTEHLCVVCGRPTPDGYACHTCGVTRPAERLREIADMAPAARDVAQRQSSRGAGGARGKAESSMPFDLGATSRLDAVQNELTGWVRHVGETRGQSLPWARYVGRDSIATIAEWLIGHVEWFRHRPEADEFLRDVEGCARVVRSLARGPAEQKYLGPCGAVRMLTDAYDDEFEYESEACDGDVYAFRGAQRGRCRVCGAEVSTAERAAWLDAQARSEAFSAKDITDAYRINVKTIRTWANRGLLATYWRTPAGLITPWIEPPDDITALERKLIEAERGPRLHYIGDVLDLAAGDALRRHEAQQKRARRAAEQAERMTA